ncbi:MAG: formyltransferase family protein [Hyphomicrobiales bacterium]
MAHTSVRLSFDARGSRLLKEEKTKKAVLLLMSELDAGFFANQLKQTAPDTLFWHMQSLAQLDETSKLPDVSMRLIAFCSGTVVTRQIIERLDFNCFNFHPGPPERPGYMPAPYAIRDGARDYGVTFHYMTPKVDEGEIIQVMRFPIDGDQNQEEIETNAYKALLTMVIQRAADLADISFRFEPCNIHWSGKKTTRADLAALESNGLQKM